MEYKQLAKWRAVAREYDRLSREQQDTYNWCVWNETRNSRFGYELGDLIQTFTPDKIEHKKD